ncbi:MAG: SUMF1/EgtB/PvdO family nonheme iron enzyme [Treponema sp.]|nr:SUMF1/EgtB/PvdO family nonheme iron enzyme [Treponema sp.]
MLKQLKTAVFRQTGSASGSNRVKRGGSWNNNANNCSVCNRNNNTPDNRNNNLGFRVVRSAQHNLF